MTSTESAMVALIRELNSAAFARRDVLAIRVTTDALPGSPAALPITPERARQVRLRAYPGDVVEADPEVWLRALEIIVHPEDWLSVIRDAVDPMERAYVQTHCEARSGARAEFMGVPVTW